MKSETVLQFSCLTPGSFFLFDPNGDVLCRLIHFKNGKALFNMIATDPAKTQQGSQTVNPDDLVYLVTDIPAAYAEACKEEFIDTMRLRLISRLNYWEAGIATAIFSGKPINFDDLKDQQHDNPALAYEMIGVEASKILSTIKFNQ